MNEENLKRILNEIGQTGVPPNVTLIAERASRNFDAALKIAQPRRWFFTPVRLIAAAAVVIFAFAAGRWLQPPQTQPSLLNVPRYASPIPTYPTNRENENSFWRPKALAAMQPRPYTQNQLSQTALLNVYKQHLKEKCYD